jgi:hypothetical protein
MTEAADQDRVLPATRWAAFVVVAILIPALVILWGLPGETADLWAWTIKPDMTPIFMGSGYGAGAFFFFRVARSNRWHPASAGVLSAAVFAALMLVATLIHWDKFNHGDAPLIGATVFYGWVGVYIASPLIVGALWLRNQRLDSRRAEPGDPIVPTIARSIALAIGVCAIAAGAFVLLSPSVAVDNWAWTLTPLTARVLGCFTVQVGLGAVLLSLDARWSSWSLLLQTFLVATGLLLAGAARAWNDFDQGNPATWAFLGGLVGMSAAALWLHAAMSRSTKRPPVP